MNLTDYSLERLAKGYLLERKADAARIHRLGMVQSGPRKNTERRPFMMLLSWWLRMTVLLIRYPVNPARVTAQMGAIAFPASILTAARGFGGAGHGRR